MSLRRLVLRDFVLVQSLELDFADGYTALTGETGAGKSILIDAIQLACGERASADRVRAGADRAEVSLGFEDLSPAVQAWLAEAGFGAEPEVLMRRTVDTQGKSRGWINGSAATAAQLRALGQMLIDIHGQHAWARLVQADAARDLLDAYGAIDTSALHAAWAHWRQAEQALTDALDGQAERDEAAERLAWRLGELRKLAPGTDEWDTLRAQQQRLAHVQSLIDAAQAAQTALDEAEPSAISRVDQALMALQKQVQLEPEFAGLTDVLTNVQAQLGDVMHGLRGYLRHTEAEPERLAEVDARLAQWQGLARRLRIEPAQLPAQMAQWDAELAQLQRDADLNALRSHVEQTQAAWASQAAQVAQARARNAPLLAQAITALLQTLGMPGGWVTLTLEPESKPTASGTERVELLVAGHPGAVPRPLARVASGGELSRVALAIAVCAHPASATPTVIFDEVDTGIGGAVASAVGRLMRRLGANQQVMAVTHLPQVAACAHQQWAVHKHSDGATGTRSTVQALSPEERVTELARMLGAEGITDSALAHARELLHPAQGTP